MSDRHTSKPRAEPATSDRHEHAGNTADLLRRETVRQAALAKLSGHAPLAPHR
jgi:hypothetical protein